METGKMNYHPKQGRVAWQSPSNIALIKYWGKKGFQIPANPSLSITLSASYTETSIDYQPGNGNIHFYFDGESHSDFEQKISKYFALLHDDLPFLKHLDFDINSKNTFPHSAGIASSASAMSALALCVCSIGAALSEEEWPSGKAFYKLASSFARIGSGSASRSVFPKMATWGRFDRIPDSSDRYANEFQLPIHPFFEGYNDTILIVSKGEKKVSSRAGHSLMEANPFAEARYKQSGENLDKLIYAIETGNPNVFISIVESEALTLHGLMMSSSPGYMLMEPATIRIIQKIKAFREQTGARICFTLDAGPNVHVLYPENEMNRVKNFIEEQLKQHCENNRLIEDKMGTGPKMTG